MWCRLCLQLCWNTFKKCPFVIYDEACDFTKRLFSFIGWWLETVGLWCCSLTGIMGLFKDAQRGIFFFVFWGGVVLFLTYLFILVPLNVFESLLPTVSITVQSVYTKWSTEGNCECVLQINVLLQLGWDFSMSGYYKESLHVHINKLSTSWIHFWQNWPSHIYSHCCSYKEITT